MSRVIKAPVFQESVHVIETTAKHVSEPSEEASVGIDLEEQARMMEEIEKKERQVEHLLESTKRSCDIMLQDAEEQHIRLMEKAKAEIEAMKEQERMRAHEEGFQQGLADGKARAVLDMQEEIRETNAKAERILQEAQEATKDYLRMAEHQVAEVVMAVVEKILPQHFIDVPQVVLPAVRQALLKVSDQKLIHIHVHPDCYEIILMARDEFRSMLTGGGADLQIVSDESLQPGDCMIETSNGTLDARLATQIELIRNAVQEILP